MLPLHPVPSCLLNAVRRYCPRPPFSVSPFLTGPSLSSASPLSSAVAEDMQQRAVDTASAGLERYNVEKDAAMYIKKEFDRLYGTTWHCVVGKKSVATPLSSAIWLTDQSVALGAS